MMYKSICVDFFRYTILLLTVLRNTTSQECKHLSAVKSDDDAMFNIVGVFPILSEYPSKLYATGVMMAEMMRFVITSFNEKHGRNIIGYIILVGIAIFLLRQKQL